ncbi:SAV_2336 N-terminal domain-related protein [Coleofasciculus chthonoplastes]|uniref:SAV_2336 N-terminal domain-related protein n=1 Tax=Coleofasciculus chthonoplastes TaxID=64178 RepID=UPI0032F363D6
MIARLLDKLQQAGLILSDEDLASFTEAESLLSAEDIADAIWLALQMGTDESPVVDDDSDGSGQDEDTSTVIIEDVETKLPPLPPPPSVPAYLPQSSPSTADMTEEDITEEEPESGLPIQVQAAPALQDKLSIARSLRPLKRKVRSQTRQVLDEAATVNRIAEEEIWLPVLKGASERWLNLEFVIEASEFSFIWDATLMEFRQILERQGAFRNVRTWWLEGTEQGKLNLVSQKSQPPEFTSRPRSPRELIDPTGRRLVLLVSDCRSSAWKSGDIHNLLKLWSTHGATAIVQLLPERLWSQSELDVGVSVQVSALTPGAPGHKLKINQRLGWRELESSDTLTVPIVTLTAKSLKQWALVVAAVGRQRTPARWFDLNWVQDEERDRAEFVVDPQSPEARIELFEATASPIAQQLATMMAAVPVSLSVVNLIQKLLLPEAKPIHLAEVYDSKLLEPVKNLTPQPPSFPPAREENSKPLSLQERGLERGFPDIVNSKVNPRKSPREPIEYDFAPGVRELLIQRTPIDETTTVLDTLSEAIAKSLNLPPIKSFTALLSPKSDWSQETQAAILPFAQIATQVLHSLGGEFASLAELVEQDAQRRTDWIKPVSEPSLPDLKTLEFETARLVKTSDVDSYFPPLQVEQFSIATITLESEPETREHDLQPFEFTVATLTRQENQWVVQRQQGSNNQFIEVLGENLILEMVAIPDGTFLMGSPQQELKSSNNERPQHEVVVSSFFMGKYPITQAQWRFVASLPKVNRILNPNPSHFKGDNRPVERVSWYNAVEFCQRLSQYTHRSYRLPTEAEWEYACRAGTTTPFHFGETITTELANYHATEIYGNGVKGEDRRETTPVDHFGIANAFGLCDMHGNVWEWCLDHWHGSYEGAPNDGSAWLTDDESVRRVRRGGSWLNVPRNCRCASRHLIFPGNDNNHIGFRVVCEIPRIRQ